MDLKVTVTVKCLDSPADFDKETVLDAFCAALGRENGALDKAFKFYVFADSASALEGAEYEVTLVDA